MHHSLCWNSITYTIHVGICMHVIAFNIPICYSPSCLSCPPVNACYQLQYFDNFPGMVEYKSGAGQEKVLSVPSLLSKLAVNYKIPTIFKAWLFISAKPDRETAVGPVFPVEACYQLQNSGHFPGMALDTYMLAIESPSENFVLLICYILLSKKSITILHLFQVWLYIHTYRQLGTKGKSQYY
jgi:hypothetical protein